MFRGSGSHQNPNLFQRPSCIISYHDTLLPFYLFCIPKYFIHLIIYCSSGKTSISSTKKLGEAASAGSRGVREETGTHSSSVHAYIGSIASSGSDSPACEQIQ